MSAPTMPSPRDVVPHRGPMLLLDAVERWDDRSIVCAATVRAEGPFVRGGRMRAAALLEHIAQAALAWVGCAGRERREPIGHGLVMAVPSFELTIGELAAGDRLRVEARLVHGMDDVARFEGTVWRGQDAVARAQISVYRQSAGGAVT